MKRILALLAVTSLGAAACGGGDSASSDPRVAELATKMLEADDALTSDSGEAKCAAEKIVNGLPSDTVDVLLESEEVDLAEVDLTIDEQKVVLDGMFECVDFNRELRDQFIADGATEEQANCATDAMGEEEMRAIVELSFADDDGDTGEEAMALIFGIFGDVAECGIDFAG
ncbi:MAG: hypothetical protein ACI8Y4_000121 [Candidatus Poriferisodalaceae bacterium]|jgi:hypothetical protein